MRQTLQAATVLLAAAAVTPAAAQFTNIFRDEPPRPPADVPRGAPPADQQRPTYQTLRPPPQQQRAPSEWVNPDLLPQNQRPQQGGVQPQGAQPGVMPGGVQSQPLAPPPGTTPNGQDGQQPLRGSQDAGLPPMQGQPGQSAPGQLPAETAPPQDEVVVPPPEQKIENPRAVFTGLDKITGRTITFDAAINETVQFGALQVTPRVCFTRPPTELPRTDAFVKVDEVTLQGDVKQIFSGWMFAASPGLNAVEHPVYDVWLIGCKGGDATASADTGADSRTAEGGAKTAAPVPVPPRQPPRRSNAPPAQPAQPGFLPAMR